jgi:NAD+-dependent protein deacetylase sirtuin 5
VKCTSFYCNYVGQDFNDPIVPALAIPQGRAEPNHEATDSLYTAMSNTTTDIDISDPTTTLPPIPTASLPHCPACKTGLLRPGVVWFGEPLPSSTISDIEAWIDASPTIDLILVIGTSSRVYPAAGYVDRARAKGARVAVVNVERGDAPTSGLKNRDWFFEGDAGLLVPKMLRSVIGEIEVPSA